jgi:hypothetical protein
MSHGQDIKVDPDEVDKVFQAMATNNFVKVRQGGINPSFLVSFVEDRTRIEAALKEISDIETYNRYLNEGENKRVYRGMEKLRDIFSRSEKYNEFQLPEPSKE